MELEKNNLKSKVLRGLAWRSSLDVSQIILQIVFTAVLARLLSKADFGLVAMALLATGFIRAMMQIGFGTAIIQDQNVSQAQVSAIFFLQILINLIIFLLCFFGAPLAVVFFNEPQIEFVIQVLAWIILLNSLAFPQIILRKEMHFGGFSLLEFGAMLAGNIVGITMAYHGYGVWSLVWRLLIQRCIFSIGVWPICKWIPVKPAFKGIGSLCRFGLHMLGSNIFYYFSQNMAAIITGKFLGVETLGAFNIAYNLAIVPAQKIQNILTSVLTPAFSKLQFDTANFRDKFHNSLFLLSFFYFPMMFGLSAIATEFVVVVYGSKWSEAGVFLSFLAIVGLIKGTEHLLRSIIISKGWSKTIFKITIIETFSSLIFIAFGGYYFGVLGLIWGYLASALISLALTILNSQKAVCDNSLFIKVTVRSLLVSISMFLIVYYVSQTFTFPPRLMLVVEIVTGVIVYTVIRYLLLTRDDIKQLTVLPFVRKLVTN